MLDDGAGRGGRGIELGDAFIGRVGVVQVVVGELLALHLARGGDAVARDRRAIERGALVRVLAIAQRLGEASAEGAEVGRGIVEHGREPVGDRRVIGRGASISLGGEAFPQRQRRRAAMSCKLGGDGRIVGGLDDDRDVGMVLRRGADHRRAADVDVLDAVVIACAPRDRVLERVEVDDEEIDRGDAVGRHGARMLFVGADREQAAMDFRMQRLDAAVHHLRKPGEIGDVAHREPGRGERLGGAAGRDELDAVSRERAGEIDEPGLVRHREKGAAHPAQLIGHDVSSLGTSPSPSSGRAGWGLISDLKGGAHENQGPHPNPPRRRGGKVVTAAAGARGRVGAWRPARDAARG